VTTECRRGLLIRASLLALALFATICVGMISLAAAQRNLQAKPYALIVGTVWGPDQRPVYGVKVKIRKADEKKARWELISDHNGEFAQRVPAGSADYIVWAEVKGHKAPAAETKVHIENDERMDIGLHLTE
jgi:hypothetical protein